MKKNLIILIAVFSTSTFATPYAYVPNEGSGTISIIDTSSDTVIGDIATNGKPRGTAVSPDGQTIYVAEQKSESLLIIDAKTKKITAKINVGDSPEATYVSNDGSLISVADSVTKPMPLLGIFSQTHN
jgi:YVTN family beta-propeller protein